MNKRILVTGGAGYLGCEITKRLLADGHHVTVLDNLHYNQHSLFHLCSNPKFEFVYGDARDKRALRKIIPNVDVLIPLAAIVGAPACDRDPKLAESVNLEAIQLVNQLRSSDQLVIYPTTNSGYGTKTGDVYCTEETPLEPISLYGRNKVQAEKELLESENAITLRLATVFGVSSRMRLDLLVNHFVYAAVTDGYIVIYEKDFKRNYIHIQDVADCFSYAVANSGKMGASCYNAGLDDANLSKEELALKIKEYIPEFYIHFAQVGSDPDKRNYIVSNERLRLAGFEASRSLDDGIRELLKCYKMFGRKPFKNV